MTACSSELARHFCGYRACCVRHTGARPGAPRLFTAGIPHHSRRSCRTRDGGGAGKARGADRRRYFATGRQCGRCRGRHRFCPGRDLSARRQHRRRRFHGDPSVQGATRTSRIAIARPRPRATKERYFLGSDGKPDIAKSRKLRARHRRARHRRGPRHRPRQIRFGQVLACGCGEPGSRWPPTAPRYRTTSPTPCRFSAGGSSAGRHQQRFSPPRRHAVARRRCPDPDAISQTTLTAIVRTGSARLIRGTVAEKLVGGRTMPAAS